MNEKLWKIQGAAFTKLLKSQLLSVQDMHAHKMIQYANNLIHMVKRIDENMRNLRKIEGK